VRGLELDLFPDPDGGLYANPLVRERLAAGPLTDPDWYRPGIKVLHTADLDYNTTRAAAGHARAEGDGRPRRRDAAFVRRNEPTGANLGEVRKRCQGGVVEPTAVPGRPPTTPALPG
jgi:hypothetical protein